MNQNKRSSRKYMDSTIRNGKIYDSIFLKMFYVLMVNTYVQLS